VARGTAVTVGGVLAPAGAGWRWSYWLTAGDAAAAAEWPGALSGGPWQLVRSAAGQLVLLSDVLVGRAAPAARDVTGTTGKGDS
jgi:hypothetical protein